MNEFNVTPTKMKELITMIEEYGVEGLEDTGDLDFLMSANGYETAFDCGNHYYLTYQHQIIGQITFNMGMPQKDEESAFEFFDEISQEAYDLWLDCLKDSDRHRHQILQARFVYLSEITIHPQLRQLDLGSLMLSKFEILMKSLKVQQTYSVSCLESEDQEASRKFLQKNGYQAFKRMGIGKQQHALFKRL